MSAAAGIASSSEGSEPRASSEASEPSASPTPPATIALSLISHTNVGKTTLMRTLLRRDLGEIADRAHVTEIAERHPLIETSAGDVLMLWDTPGFGDSARLLKRLRASENPIRWLLTQVWDRLTDRPFYSSQQAIRNARDESDVILYLVNAAEDPRAAGYVDAEMQILAWMGKPVLLLLNQTGAPRTRDDEAGDEETWRRHLSVHSVVRGIIALDAFARCWVQEDTLLGAVTALVSEAKRASYARLHHAWRARNLEVFDASMRLLAKQIAVTMVDREPVEVPASLGQRTGRWLASLGRDKRQGDPDETRAMNALGNRLDEAVREATDRIIGLHGLSGRAGEAILERMSRNFEVAKPADAGKSGVIGGVVTGALGGLAADLAAGGLTFGAGALIGGILGALGGTGAAKAYNLARGAYDSKVGWSPAFILQLPAAALLRYLAIAHFGRGRGNWIEGEYPAHWAPIVDAVVARHADEVSAATRAVEAVVSAESVSARMHPVMAVMGSEVLIELYPDVRTLFTPAMVEIEFVAGRTESD